MAHKILWTVTPEVHRHITHLTSQLHNRAITEAQWIDEVMHLPGYPLRGRPSLDEELTIQVARPTQVAVPGPGPRPRLGPTH